MNKVLASRIGKTLAVIVLMVGLLAAIFILAPRNDGQPLSPGSTRPDGAGATAEVLRERGIDVVVINSWEEAIERADSQSTVLIQLSNSISQSDVDQLIDSGATIVLIADDYASTARAWGFDGRFEGTDSHPVRAQCEESNAVAAQGISPVDRVYMGDESGCFPSHNGFAWVKSDEHPRISLFTAPETFTNAELASPGNAAFAFHTLGSQPTLLWIHGAGLSSSSSTNNEPSVDALPSWFTAGSIAALLTAAWYAMYKSRRFGKLVPEPLPVIVPAAEAELGRARLYQRGRNVAHAGASLRAGMISRVAPRLGLTPNMDPSSVVQAMSRASAAEPNVIFDLLYAREVTSERDLATLSRQLTALEKELT